jgi:trigger factor
MQIEIKEIEPCKLSIQYETGAEDILNKRGQIIQHFKKAPVPGYRPGKATLEAIKHHYKNQIEEAMKRALAEDAYHNTLFEKKLRPHGAPRFNQLILADGKFTCQFDLHTKPDFEMPQYQNLEIPKPHEPYTAAEVTEKMLQELRTKFGETVPYSEKDFVQTGDNVIINYEGSIDGIKVDSLCSQGEVLTVGHSQLTSFDDNLLGMALGEEREFNLVVPENGLPSMKGKTIHFKVVLNMGSKNSPCPLNDELAIKVGKKDYNELREFIHGTAQARTSQHFKTLLNEAVAQQLVTSTAVEVPNWMGLSEAQYLVHSAKLDWTVLPDVDKEKYLEMGIKNVKLSLILDKIRELEPEAQLSDQEVFDVIKRNVADSKLQTSFDEVIKEMDRTGYLQILMSRLRDEFTLDFITKSIRIIE